MTIVVGVATPEGLVLAGDSRATLVDLDGRHRIASDSVQKVFRIGRFGVANYGALLIGAETVTGLMEQFAVKMVDTKIASTVKLIEGLREFVLEKFLAANPDWDESKQGYALGFLVAGYDEDGVGRIHNVTIPDVGLEDVDITTVSLGVIWQGQQDAFERLYYGYDEKRLEDSGVKLAAAARDALQGLVYELNDPVTVQDAIDCACFIVRTTVDMQRFSMGARSDGDVWQVPGCGGPVQVLAIDPGGPTWVEQLQLRAPKRPTMAEGELT